jgi:predicted nucleotidyltransferase
MDAKTLAELAARHGIVLLLQFGSTVSGKTHASSDVDLAVLLSEMPASFAAQADLTSDLQRLVPDREADVAIVNHADPLFLHRITTNCRLLHGSPKALAQLKLYAFKRYQDHRRFLAMEFDYVARRVRALSR